MKAFDLLELSIPNNPERGVAAVTDQPENESFMSLKFKWLLLDALPPQLPAARTYFSTDPIDCLPYPDFVCWCFHLSSKDCRDENLWLDLLEEFQQRLEEVSQKLAKLFKLIAHVIKLTFIPIVKQMLDPVNVLFNIVCIVNDEILAKIKSVFQMLFVKRCL